MSGDPASEAVALEAVAAVQWSMAQWPEAIVSFQRMLEAAVSAGELELQSIARGGLGGAESAAARIAVPDAATAGFERARGHLLEYLRLATELGDVHAMRAATHNLAVLLISLNERRAARATLESLIDEDADSETRALSLRNLADLDCLEGDPAAAVRRLEQAHTLLGMVCITPQRLRIEGQQCTRRL